MSISSEASELIRHANRCYAQKDYQQALEAYRQAIALDAECRPFTFIVGDILKELQRYEEAAQAYREVVEHTPMHDQAWASLGECLMLLDHREEAVQAFNRCLDLEPKTTKAWYYAAMVYTLLGDSNRADQYLHQALHLNPDWKQSALRNRLLRAYVVNSDQNHDHEPGLDRDALI